jgi:TonB-dependent receptor
MSHVNFSRTLQCSVLAVAFFATVENSTHAVAQPTADSPSTVRIEPLRAALERIESETGMRIEFDPSRVRGRTARVTADDITDAEQALNRVLQGTDLAFEPTGEGGYRIVAASAARELDQIIVTGTRQARADALNRKRAATNIADYALSDDVNKLPDRNLADALSRLPGISVQEGLADGRFVSIRGISPELNQLSVNGQISAVSDVNARRGRAGPLDVVGAGDFASIEVSKTLRPDMDAQGLGGQINVNSPSALEQGDRFGFAQLDYGGNDTNDREDFGGSFGAGDLFFNDRLGVYVGGTYSERDLTVNRFEGEWARTDSGQSVPVKNILTVIDETRERLSGTTNIEYRVDDRSKLYFRAVYNRITDDGYRPEIENELDEDTVVLETATSGTATVEPGQLKTRLQEAEREILNLSVGGELHFGIQQRWRWAPELAFSSASEIRNPLRFVEFNVADEDEDGTFDFSDPLFAIDSPLRFDPEAFEFDKIRFETGVDNQAPAEQEEDIFVIENDLGYDHGNVSLFGTTGFLETTIGAKFTLRDREVNEDSNRWESVGPLDIEPFSRPGPDNFRGRFRFGPIVEFNRIADFFFSNPDQFRFQEVSSTTNSIEDDYDAEEDILAGYVMSEGEFGKLSFLAGVRIERTELQIEAFEAIFVDDEFQGIENRSEESEYTDVFPNVQLRYEVAPNLIARGSFYRSLGRPDFVDLAPIGGLEVEEVNPGVFRGSLETGNPDLEPFESNNFDVSLEYYFAEGAVLAASGFYKQIDNPIFVRGFTLENVERDQFFLEELDVEQTENADEGDILGLELTYQQQFDFLPGLWRGLGVAANATFLDSEVTVFDRDDDLPFFNQPDRIFNAQLFYEFGRVQARLAYQYTDERLLEIGSGNAVEDFYQDERETLSAKLTLQVLDNAFVFVEGENLTEESVRRFQEVPAQVALDDELGRVFRGGFSIVF